MPLRYRSMLQLRRPTESDRRAAVQHALDARPHDVPRARPVVREETIGWGIKRYERARTALARLEQLNLPGVVVAPATTAETGRRFVVFARRLGLWTSAPVEVTGFHLGDRSLSYTLRALDGHPLAGEETFTVTRETNGIVRFRIEATSRPRSGWARAITPALRIIQRRFRGRAISHMRNATGMGRSIVTRARSPE